MNNGKAVVIGANSEPVMVPFANLNDENPVMSGSAVLGVLVVINCLNKFLRKAGEHDTDREKLVDGLSSEISLSYSDGWSNLYYCTFRNHHGFTLEDLPHEFSTSNDDGIFYFNQRKKLIEVISEYKSTLRKIRLVGIIGETQLDKLVKELSVLEVDIELDSPYLVTVDDA